MLGPGIPIGRIFGIRIYIDPSWIFIFLLVTWNLAAGALAVVHPEWGTTTIWLVAIVASLLFLDRCLLMSWRTPSLRDLKESLSEE